jgi:hypothetical protein
VHGGADETPQDRAALSRLAIHLSGLAEPRS